MPMMSNSPADAGSSDQQQSLPTIAPVSSNTADSASAAYKALQDAIPPEVKVTASPYSSGTAPDKDQVTLPQAQVRGMVDSNRRPFNDSLSERNHARNINTWASVSNTITQFRNKQEADKTAALTTSIATVMKAQQQIDNATAVINSPTATKQDKEMAQGVIDQNKKVIEGKLTDPKSGKAILKAFDVSMTDPESQKTPEHQAAKAAAKQVATATKAGLTADTPAEKAIQDKVTGADASGQVQKQQQSAQQTQAAKNPSATPYADKFLGSMPASIGTNPEYAAQMQQKAERDKIVEQYILPKMYDAVASQQRVAMQQEGANARVKYAGAVALMTTTKRLANEVQTTDSKNATELRKQGMADAAAMARTTTRVNAMLQVANDKKLDPKYQEKAKNDAIDELDKSVTHAQAGVKNIQDIIAGTKDSNTGLVRPEMQSTYNGAMNALKIANVHLEQAQDERQKQMTALYGTPVVNPNDPNNNDATAPYTKVQNATDTGTTADTTGTVSGSDNDGSSEDGGYTEDERNDIIEIFSRY